MRPHGWTWPALTALALVAGLVLIADEARVHSASYDEVAYLKIAARWWRTGDQEQVTRMGSPLTFWKIQQAPTLWMLDRLGRSSWIDAPEENQARLLPYVRLGSLWIWALALGLTALWARRLHGPRAMAAAAWWFALSPNLLAHGSLATMELPLVAATTLVFVLFWRFLETRRRSWFLAASGAAGLAFSCKFTAILLPPILGLVWWLDVPDRLKPRTIARVAAGMLAFLAIMAVADLVVTGFATLAPSEHRGAHPSLERLPADLARRIASALFEARVPQDWVGFARQWQHQRSGGPSYLFGERRTHGWWYYYFVCLVAKVPPTCLLALVIRGGLVPRAEWSRADRMILAIVAAMLAIVAMGSSRNYGVRYLLPLAPPAIVWVSALAARGRVARVVLLAGLAGQAAAVASCHPHELSYFSPLAGGPRGGRAILADSNLDWGQGARLLAGLQARRPEFRDLTTYYFGDTDPGHYGVLGVRHVINADAKHPALPVRFGAETRYVAVSTSLQYGPWGPPGYFDRLRGVRPVAMTRDVTIAIYRTRDIPPEQPPR